MTRKKRSAGEGGKGVRADGLYYGSVTLPNGKRKYVYAKTTKQRDAKLLELQLKVRRGEVVPKRQSVAEYLEWWLTNQVEPSDLEPYSKRAYRKAVRHDLIPALGARPLAQLTPQQVQAMLAALGQRLAPRTVLQIRSVLRRALHHALRYGLVTRNVAELTDPPKVRSTPVTPYRLDEARAVLAAVQGDRLEALYTVALSIGLRQAETLGLRWEDVDLERCCLEVRRQLQRQDGQWVLKAVKSQTSQRTVHLPGFALAALRRHRARQAAERLAAGPGWEDQGLVFCREDGRPVSPRWLLYRWNEVVVRAGVRRIKYHDLRHTAASLMIAQGASLQEVKETLGHASIAVTSAYYAHLYDDARRQLAERMDAAFSTAKMQ